MTSKLKCPVCNHKLYQTASEPATYCCLYKDCTSDFKFAGSKELWQALIRRTNQLNIAITDILHAYKSLMGGCAEWRVYLEQTLKQIQDLDNDKQN